MKRALCLVMAALAVVAFGMTRTEQIRAKLASGDRSYVFVAMHRGDWRNYPENSRDAICAAIALGADIVELDARMTKDGRFVLLHDNSLDRTTNGKGKVGDRTYAEIKDLKLRSGQGGAGSRVTDYPVMTLEEALEITRGKILVNIDKFKEHPREILEAVDRVGALKEVLVKSPLSAAQAKVALGPYWSKVESGELLYMPVVHCGKKDGMLAAPLMTDFLALEPRRSSMYEVCLKDEPSVQILNALKAAPGKPRIWINMMWNSLAAGRGELDESTKGKPVLHVADPDALWGRPLAWGATVIQTDYGAELLVYLNRLGRHTL